MLSSAAAERRVPSTCCSTASPCCSPRTRRSGSNLQPQRKAPRHAGRGRLRWAGWPRPGDAVRDHDGRYAISARQVQLLRDAGAPAAAVSSLRVRHGAAWTGDFAGTASDIARPTASRRRPVARSSLDPAAAPGAAGARGRGRCSDRGAIEEAAPGRGWRTTRTRPPPSCTTASPATGSGGGGPAGRLEHARSWVTGWVLPELVEAPARGKTPNARDALERLAGRRNPTRTTPRSASRRAAGRC